MQSYLIYERYRELQRYIGWTDEDAVRVHALAPVVQQYFGELIDDFYEAIQQNPATTKIITGGSAQIERLKRTLVKWLEELFSGRYDQEYVVRRWKVGLRHVEIGLQQVYTNAALSRLRIQLLDVLKKESGTGDEVLKARSSLNKLLDLDLAIIEEAYRTEQQRRQQQIERLATIGQVAGGIAHELRNPLNVIKTSVYFLRNAQRLTAEKLAVHLERIDRQATQADAVIGALNNFARLPVPEMVPVDVQLLVDEAVAAGTLPETITVDMQIPAALTKVLGDPTQLGIVLVNLVRNARDAMTDGGTMQIVAREMDGFVEIDVNDTGGGVPAENLARVMEPLFSTKARGIGLGLAISRAIVEKHQGELKVESVLGKGSTFTVRLMASHTPHLDPHSG